MAAFTLLVVMFKCTDTKAIILFVLLFVTVFVSAELGVGYPAVPLGASFINLFVMVSLFIIEFIFRKKASIWNFLVRN